MRRADTADTTTELGDVVARLLAAPDDAPALVGCSGATVTYGALRDLVAARAAELAGPRGVVALSGSRSVDWVACYLGALAAGHVVLLAGDHVDELIEAWDPAMVVRVRDEGHAVERRHGRAVALHPDLRLLMSTSGSTGSPKLVRLSARNLVSNADAIVEALGLTARDRGITSLPLHYCYGLSVLHSHLAAGASVVLAEASVVDPCFRAALAEHGVTNMAAVPHSLELLERAGPELVHVPSLRLVTVAGGKVAPDRVAAWVRRTQHWGAAFVVMYGQTEATARVAVLPPALARRRPGAIGVPVPGGSLELAPVDGADPGVGELVYRGPNVMLGYASEPADLARGAEVAALHTGDLGRFHPDDGVFEVVGRRSRFVKPFGLRIDLDRVEAALARRWTDVVVAGDDERLVAVVPGADPADVRAAMGAATGLPPTAVHVDVLGPVPRTAAGKVDTAAVLRRATASTARRDDTGATVAAVFADVLGRRDVRGGDTFVGLGGDSLSYIECAERLTGVIGRLPSDWHLRPVHELDAGRRAPARAARLDATVVLRAVGICCVVATHMHLAFVPGGAHLMLAVVGYNVSRFLLPVPSAAARLRAGLRTIARVALPVVAWVAVGLAIGASYGVGTLLLVNNYVGPRSHAGDHWHFWFIEVFAHLVLATTLLSLVPAVRRADRRWSYGLPLAVLGATLLLRLEWAQLDDWYNLRYRTHGVAWFFVLGWLVHRSTSVPQRLVTSLVCLAVVPGFFGLAQRDWFITAGLVALVWVREVPLPRAVAAVVSTLGAASMWILVTHFTVWPPLDRVLEREVAYVLTLLVGVAAWWAVERVPRWWRRAASRRRTAPWGGAGVERFATV